MNDNYCQLITSQYKKMPRFNALVKASTDPLLDVIAFLRSLNANFDLSTTNEACLTILAEWTGTPLLIPGGVQSGFFGFSDQENSQTFGELDDLQAGGYFREIGQNGTSGLIPTSNFLRRLIKAKILQNSCFGYLSEAKEIIKLVLDHEAFMIADNKDMTVTFTFNTSYSSVEKTLVQMFFPLPMGVLLIFGD